MLPEASGSGKDKGDRNRCTLEIGVHDPSAANRLFEAFEDYRKAREESDVVEVFQQCLKFHGLYLVEVTKENWYSVKCYVKLGYCSEDFEGGEKLQM